MLRQGWPVQAVPQAKKDFAQWLPCRPQQTSACRHRGNIRLSRSGGANLLSLIAASILKSDAVPDVYRRGDRRSASMSAGNLAGAGLPMSVTPANWPKADA
jgi:hypothetical protein